MKEYEVGSIHEHDGNLVECIESKPVIPCEECFYDKYDIVPCICLARKRKDGKDVIFKKVEG